MCINVSLVYLISHLHEVDPSPEKSCFLGEEQFQERIEGQCLNVKTEGHTKTFKMLSAWDRFAS